MTLPAALAEQLAAAALKLDATGVPVVSALVVDLDAPAAGVDVAEVCAAAASGVGVVTVGRANRPLAPAAAELASALDCTLVPAGEARSSAEVGVADPETSASEIAARVRDAPRAAATLVQLLRATGQLPVQAGLAAESAAYSMLLAGPEFARWRAGRTRRPPRPADGDTVHLSRDGSHLLVTIDRPERRNAFDRAVRDGLIAAFDLVVHDPSIDAVTLLGAGPSFCSGGDLDEFGTSTDVTAAHLIRLDRSVASRVHRCRAPVTARLHGACIGAGIEIPSFAGRVIAVPDTFVQLPELAMGLVPGAGGTVGITRRIGRWRTAYLALSGSQVTAVTAHEWGLIDVLQPA